MIRTNFLLILLTGVFCIFICHSCSTCSRPQKIENLTVNIDMADLSIDSLYINMGKRVLFALPTPIEASMLIKNWGIPYPELLNDPAFASGYTTRKQQALNFGVYLTDMTTAGLYEQSQTVLRYKQAIMQLIEGLGLQSVASPAVLQKIEDNINNRQELLEIISEIYASCTEFLSEDDRDFYALAMLAGGWVEGMFIATSTLDENQVANRDKMKSLVFDNKLTFDLLWQALGDLNVIPEDAFHVMIDMSYIAHLFGHQTLISKSFTPKVAINDANDVTVEFYAELKTYIHQLRQSFVKK